MVCYYYNELLQIGTKYNESNFWSTSFGGMT